VQVRHYEPSAGGQWDALVERSRAPHFLFKRGYMEYHADRFRDLSLMVWDDDRLLACLPANREGDVAISHGGLTFGGFVADRGMTARRMLETLEAVVEHLGEQGCTRLVYKAVPHIYHLAPAEGDLYALFRHDARLVRRDVSSTIDMAERGPYRKDRRAAIKRAAAAGLSVDRGEGWEEFMDLDAAVVESRHGVRPVHTGPEMRMLAERFPEAIKLFTARRDGELLGGVVVYETPRVAHTQYMAAGEKGRELGALDAILDRLLSDEYAGKRFFDFGISTEREGRHLNLGLVGNKESYGASATVYDSYELPLRA
jgi:GNAT acetyltransferase-like protein